MVFALGAMANADCQQMRGAESMLSLGVITSMVIGVSIVTMVLLTHLLIQVYRVEDGARLPAKSQKQQ